MGKAGGAGAMDEGVGKSSEDGKDRVGRGILKVAGTGRNRKNSHHCVLFHKKRKEAAATQLRKGAREENVREAGSLHSRKIFGSSSAMFGRVRVIFGNRLKSKTNTN